MTPHLPDPELYGQKRRRRRIFWAWGISCALLYGAAIWDFWIKPRL